MEPKKKKKSRGNTLPTQVHLVKATAFPVVLYGCECWIIKKAESQELMLLNCAAEDSWKSLGQEGDQTSQSKINLPWILIGKTDAEAPVLWPPNVKRWITGKDPDAGKDWRQDKKRVTKDEMVGWHHRLNGQEFEQTQGDTEGQRILVCFNPWGHKELDTT